jgi:hypothetical protein
MPRHPFFSAFRTGLAVLLVQSAAAAPGGPIHLLPEIHAGPGAGTFPLVSQSGAAAIVHDAGDARVVGIAVGMLAGDIETVSGGTRPAVATSTDGLAGRPIVLVGTVGASSFIDGLIAEGKLDTSAIVGKWECYHFARVAQPLPGIDEAFVIAGSDRRGTAYGTLALGEALGVSPWIWWADTPPPPHGEIHLAGTPGSSTPPSVKFRGIFINDEDWGLQEWAEKNYESGTGEVKDLGPKSYAKIFELLLRLRANFCWPGMHPSTRAFHYYTENKQVADDHAIVMGSSHAEPMLRNNVDEWSRFTSANGYSSDWNYATNKTAIYDYWDTRARDVGAFENVYTVGKRGIHDSGMVEGSTTAEKAAWLNTIFTDQRQIIANRVNPAPEQVPQIFVPYKEVLSIYESGLVNVPDDVTLVWPDDNHGYIRRLSNNAEQQRPGGGGVYYHLSYWGSPADYLWLETTPPSLVWEEMTKAAENNCRRLWVFNVGDIKPAEIVLEFAMRLAWDVDAHGPDCQLAWLSEWATREFGADKAGAIASLMNDYYLLNHRRRPEHMDWKDDDPGASTPVNGDNYPLFSHVHEGDEAARRLERMAELRKRADAIYTALPAGQRDAFYQLVAYPVRASDAMNRKFLQTSLAWRDVAQKRKSVAARSAAAAAAYNEIIAETDYYNNTMAGGKWREMMDWKPRGLSVFNLPAQPTPGGPQSLGLGVAVEGRLAPQFTEAATGGAQPIELHAVDDATLTAPMQEATLDGRRCTWTPGIGGIVAAGDGGRAVYSFSVPATATYRIRFEVRTPNPEDDSWWIQLDGGSSEKWNDLGIGNPIGWKWETWKTLELTAGAHTLTIHEREDGAAMATILLEPPSVAGGELGEDDRFPDFRLPEFNGVTRRSFFLDLINTNPDPIAWSVTSDDSWVLVSQSAGTLDDELRLNVSIDWGQLPAQENLHSALHLHQGANTIDVPVAVWNPATPPAVDFIEENGSIVMEAEHFTSAAPGTDASWIKIPGMGQGDGTMIVSPTTVPSRTSVGGILSQSPRLEYTFHLRNAGTRSIQLSFLPALALNNERGRRYAVAIDDEDPQIVALSSESGSGTIWSRSVLRASIHGSSSHDIPDSGVHTLKVWMVDPGLVLDRIVIETGSLPHTYHGPRETAAASRNTLRIAPGETFILDETAASYLRIVNEGTLEIRSSALALDGDLLNFGTLRVTGASDLDLGGNLANFGLLDAMTWTAPPPASYSEFGSVMDASLFHVGAFRMENDQIHIDVPGYVGHPYQLYRSESLALASWLPEGPPQNGTGTPGAPATIQFTSPANADRVFFRVGVE